MNKADSSLGFFRKIQSDKVCVFISHKKEDQDIAIELGKYLTEQLDVDIYLDLFDSELREATIGIGNSSVTIKYDGCIKEIAYKIWIELTTRKIGLKFDEKYDIISEVYDSWYEAFKVIRTLLANIPANRISDAKGLIDITTKVLNNGLRPHLTAWQAKYRAWYNSTLSDATATPQEIQRTYPEYQLLIDDLKKTNDIMIKYADELKRLIDYE